MSDETRQLLPSQLKLISKAEALTRAQVEVARKILKEQFPGTTEQALFPVLGPLVGAVAVNYQTEQAVRAD